MIKVILITSLLLTSLYAQREGEAERILYIRGEFSDKPMGLNDKKWLKRIEKLHETLQAYWKSHSYGKIPSLHATYTPILKLGTTKEHFHYDALAKGMRDAAAKAGFPRKDFDHLVFLYPGIKHNISFGGLGGGGQIWLPGSAPFDGGLIHEFGHSLGLGHANSIEGEKKASYPGQRREGRDGLHMMGSDGDRRVGHYSTINLPMRYVLKFIGDEHIRTVKSDGVYRIHEYELEEAPYDVHLGLRLKVKEEDFWISFNPKMVKRWSNFRSACFKKGVMVHRLKGTVTDLLDFTPGSDGKSKNEEDYIDTRDGALVVGNHFTFPESKISLLPTAIGEDAHGIRYIDVQVTFEQSAAIPRLRNLSGAEGEVLTQEHLEIKAKTRLMTPNTESVAFYSVLSSGKEDLVSATIKSFENADSQSRAGVMMRTDDSGGSPHVSLFLAGDASLAMLWRSNRGTVNKGLKIQIEPGMLKKLSLRLQKTDSTVSGEYSLDGETWTTVKSINIPTPKTMLKGVAVCSGSSSREVIARFDEVQLNSQSEPSQ